MTLSSTHKCKVCFRTLPLPSFEMKSVSPSLALGEVGSDSSIRKFDFDLVQCPTCELIQQLHIPSLDILKPKFGWQRFREPEQHLDELASQIWDLLPKVNPPKITGISWQDSTLLSRLKLKGSNTVELDPIKNLRIPDDRKPFGIETLQDKFSEEIVSKITLQNGLSDCVIARDILEHSFRPIEFLKGLSALAKDDGLVVIEVPGSIDLLNRFKYWLLWEHHISYFTKSSLSCALREAGLTPVLEQNLTLDAGEYLVVIAKKEKQRVSLAPEKTKGSFLPFVEQYPIVQQEIRNKLQAFLDQKKTIFFYGANHVSFWWLQVFNATSFFTSVVDDSPEKQGLYLPGTDLKIVGSDLLNSQKSAVCLTLFGPQTIAKILPKLDGFSSKGGILLSAENLCAKV